MFIVKYGDYELKVGSVAKAIEKAKEIKKADEKIDILQVFSSNLNLKVGSV